MSSDARGGITRTGSGTGGDPYAYSVKPGRGQNPVVYVDFYDTLRFSNWLHNGQGAEDTETGAYTLLGGTAIPTNVLVMRNAGANFFLTSEDEWYKAAYYDPDTDSYFDYATSSDTRPTSEAPAGGANSANYKDPTTGYALTGSTTFDNTNSFNYLTDVGAYTGSVSPYGTFDQTGSVWELNEALVVSVFRSFRGGSWGGNFFGNENWSASGRLNILPAGQSSVVGFRVASRVATTPPTNNNTAVPEPATMFLSALAGVRRCLELANGVGWRDDLGGTGCLQPV